MLLKSTDALNSGPGGTIARRVDIFFYGLFMDLELLRQKGLTPVNPRKSHVEGFRLLIGRRATLVPDPGSRAYGMVMGLSSHEIAQIYSWPGLERYFPEAVLAHPPEGDPAPALCYILAEPPPAHERNPEYAAQLRASLQALGFPAEYIASV